MCGSSDGLAFGSAKQQPCGLVASIPSVDEFQASAREWLEANRADAPRDYGPICPPGLIDEGVRWQQRLWATRAEIEGGADGGGGDLDALAATTRLVFPAGDRFGLYARLDYFDQTGFDPPVSDPASDPAGFSRTRWSAGVIVGLGGPPSTWGLREEPTLLLRTLRPGLD